MIDKIFPRKLNRSKDARLHGKTEMYDALNVSVDDFDTSTGEGSDTGDAGVIKPVKGNKAVSQSFDSPLPSTGSKRVVGSVADQVNNELFLFVFSSNGSEQGVYRVKDQNTEAVYTSDQFQFLSDDFVKGDIIYQADGDRILYFTDGRNEPRRLPLFKEGPGEEGTIAQRIDYITACPKTPMHPPTWEFFADSSRSVNFRSVEGFQFAYQCIYNTGEESAISTYSDVAVPPAYLSQGALSDPNLEASNALRITVPGVVNGIENYTANIESVRLLVRIGNQGSFFTVSEKDVNDTGEILFDFYNDSVLTGVPQEDQDKLNDALPRVARSQTIVNDRLIYGNYVEGYETGPVKASFTTINNPRPADFIDLKIGVIPLTAPAFRESEYDGPLSVFNQQISTIGELETLNRRSSYQFDLSDLPLFLPQGSTVEISFAIEPDGNFELYNSENSFHTHKKQGFQLNQSSFPNNSVAAYGIRRVSDNGYSLSSGSPTVLQDNDGVVPSGLSWTVTDELENESLQQVENIKFGTSPSNPFIIPQALVRFKARFKVVSEVSGSGSVKTFITNVLKSYFSDGSIDVDGADFTTAETAEETIDQLFDIGQGRNPDIEINQFMDSSDGYGLIGDDTKQARTVISCFSDDEYQATGIVPPVGFFALNKATVTFGLRHSDQINQAVEVSSDHSVGPVFSLHVEDVRNIETVTMVPRITRSGARGWIYFTKDFLQTADQGAVRRICLKDSPDQFSSEVESSVTRGTDFNIFFLNAYFNPITNNNSNLAEIVEGAGVSGGVLREHTIRPDNFLNADGLETLPQDQFSETGLFFQINTFAGYQDTTPVSTTFGNAFVVPDRTELDSDFRVSGGTSSYPELSFDVFGNGEQGTADSAALGSPKKRRCIGYLNLNDDSEIIRTEDPNASSGGSVYSIADGDVNIRNKEGRLNPSFWYGVYFGTEYAGRNNSQFAFSEGSDSDSPVGLLHGGFDFFIPQPDQVVDESIPEIESGRTSFSLTSDSTVSGALGRSFKRNCDHSFALVYYDERGRPGEPVPLGSHFVSPISNPGMASIRLDIDDNFVPPVWAHTYKVLYGGNTSISDFVQYTSGGAFAPKGSGDEKGVIYVSLNYLQNNNEVSYSKAFGAVRADGDKDLYTFSEGDRLRVISYYNDEANVQYPQVNDPYEFQVIGTVTLDDDPVSNPLAIEGEEVHPAKTGQFVIIKDNQDASGFNFQDVSNSLSEGQTSSEIYNPGNYWNRRCVFEIFSPQKKREVEGRVYYEIGGSYNVVRSSQDSAPIHQTTSILLDQGDVYFRKMAVNMPEFEPTTGSFAGLIGNGTDTIDEATSPNFRSYHLESKAFTDIFPNADALPYGKPRVATQKVQPIRTNNEAQSSGSSNRYVRQSSIKFSDRSNANSNVVRYTSFNDSKLPFKDLQTNDGEIFYLVNYNDSIFCIQRLKCSFIPVARNILADALGNETVITTAKVLGTEKYYAGSYGTDVPESVAQADSAVYFVSVRQKEVYRFNPNSGIEVISEKGMASFFDTMISDAEDSNAFKMVGGFDVDQQEYILSSTDSFSIITAAELADFSNVVSEEEVADDFEVGFEPEEPTEDSSQVVQLLGVINDLQDQIQAQGQQIFDLNEDVAASFQAAVDSVVVDVTLNDDQFLSDTISEIFQGDTTAFDDGGNYQFVEAVIEWFNNVVDSPGIADGLQAQLNQLNEAADVQKITFQAITDALYSGAITQDQAKELLDGLRFNNADILADLNADGAVTIADIMLVNQAFGSVVDNIDVNPYFDKQRDPNDGDSFPTPPLIDAE